MEKTKPSDIRNTLRLREEPELWRIIGSSKEIKDVLAKIQTVLESDVPVVIQGETGTGKELVVKAIHYRGPRSKQPLCTINCTAIPENLLESELMGHEKGAFTGAIQQQIGKLERANLGTLFLDEVTEMSLAMQAKILRVIEEQVFERVGGNKLIKTNARIISATNKELLDEVHSKNFREDLYYRLNVFRIHIPPLRERKDDIPELVSVFINRFGILSGKKINKLTDEEFKTIKSHVVKGSKILELMSRLRTLMPSVRHHHERYDGRGYPDGLKGDEIHLVARIISIADTYDAMTTSRVYRKGLPKEVAYKEIEKGAGTQFDPKLALAFVDFMKKNTETTSTETNQK